MKRDKKQWIITGRKDKTTNKQQEWQDKARRVFLENSFHHNIFWYEEGKGPLWYKYNSGCSCRRCDRPNILEEYETKKRAREKIRVAEADFYGN